MIGPLPLPLEDDWAPVLAEVAREARLVPLDDPKLPELVSAMAAVYNDPTLASLRKLPREQLAARLAFWFPRDVPKMAGAVREVLALGRLDKPALKVVDIGAGLGASHRGLARALAAAGRTTKLTVRAIDDDDGALKLAAAIAKKRPREGSVELRVDTEVAGFDATIRGRYDVVLVGQVLSELDRKLPEPERLERHAEKLTAFAKYVLDPDGVMIVVEPALRPRSRHLQALRAPLVERGLSIVAPCLHQGRCPLLGRETDWCHDDLPVDLPSFLVPIAKRAGLRWEGLTFSYLVLSMKPARLRDAFAADRRVERAVSGLLVTKGKRELVVCGDPLRPDVPPEDLYGPFGARMGRLDRARTRENEAFDDVVRGDVLAVGPLDEKLRLGPESSLVDLRAPERAEPASEKA